MRWSVAVWAAVAPLLLSGCSPTSTAGTAQPAPTATPGSVAELSYDPCTQVTDAMISSLGFDPATKKPYRAGVDRATEMGCAWKDSATMTRLGVDIGKNLSTVDQYRKNPTFNGVTELTIGGHAAVNFVTDTAGGWVQPGHRDDHGQRHRGDFGGISDRGSEKPRLLSGRGAHRHRHLTPVPLAPTASARSSDGFRDR